MINVVKITVTQIIKQNGAPNGFRYTAHFEDGSTEIIRQRSTRLYDNAYYYEKYPVASSQHGIAAHFSFGKNPFSGFGKHVTRSWTIEVATEGVSKRATAKATGKKIATSKKDDIRYTLGPTAISIKQGTVMETIIAPTKHKALTRDEIVVAVIASKWTPKRSELYTTHKEKSDYILGYVSSAIRRKILIPAS